MSPAAYKRGEMMEKSAGYMCGGSVKAKKR